jgi:hypothetical protein
MKAKQRFGLALVVAGVFPTWAGSRRFFDPPVAVKFHGYCQLQSPAAGLFALGIVMIVVGTLLMKRWS